MAGKYNLVVNVSCGVFVAIGVLTGGVLVGVEFGGGVLVAAEVPVGLAVAVDVLVGVGVNVAHPLGRATEPTGQAVGVKVGVGGRAFWLNQKALDPPVLALSTNRALT